MMLHSKTDSHKGKTVGRHRTVHGLTAIAPQIRHMAAQRIPDPRLLMADGNAAIWGAVRQVWPEAGEQRCWNHKMRNVLDRLPQREQSEAKDLLRAVVYAPSRAEAVKAREVFARRYRPWYPKAVDVLEDDWERMVAFYDFPEDHWKHLRTTNVVESPRGPSTACCRSWTSNRLRHVTRNIVERISVQVRIADGLVGRFTRARALRDPEGEPGSRPRSRQSLPRIHQKLNIPASDSVNRAPHACPVRVEVNPDGPISASMSRSIRQDPLRPSSVAQRTVPSTSPLKANPRSPMMDSARLMARLGAPFRVSASPVSSGVTTQSECIMVIDRDTETSSSLSGSPMNSACRLLTVTVPPIKQGAVNSSWMRFPEV